MAKVINAKKSHLYMLNKLMAKIPKQSMEENSMKIINFFRAVKKPLRKQLDESAEIQKVVDEKLVDVRKEYAELQKQLSKLESNKTPSEENMLRIDALNTQMKELIARGDSMIKKENEQLKAIQDDLNQAEATATFDNEDFNYVEAIFKKNSFLFQVGPEGKEQFDMETMDIVFSMFDNATIPASKE